MNCAAAGPKDSYGLPPLSRGESHNPPLHFNLPNTPDYKFTTLWVGIKNPEQCKIIIVAVLNVIIYC